MNLQEHQAILSLVAVLQNASTEEQQLLFLPTGIHPEWEDQEEIFQLAISQILEPIGTIANEFSLAFIGMHSRTIFTGKRDSIGFLITDQRVLVQTDVSVIGTADKAHLLNFTTTQTVDEVNASLWKLFEDKLKTDVPQEQMAAMQSVLSKVLQVVLPVLQQSGHLPSEIKTATTFNERVQQLGLQTILKFPAGNEKLFAKVATKFAAKDIRCGAVDKTLFGGAYGLVFTNDGISSRDLMEEPEHTSWNILKQHPAVGGSEPDTIMIANQRHIMPKYQAESRAALITLMNEMAQGKVS